MSEAALIEACLADPETDAVVVMLVPQALSAPAATAEALVAACAGKTKPVVACWMGEETVRGGREVLEKAGIPDLSMPERAVEAFDQLASYGRNQRLLRQVPEPLSPQPTSPSSVRTSTSNACRIGVV